jgi:hypothetical protein
MNRFSHGVPRVSQNGTNLREQPLNQQAACAEKAMNCPSKVASLIVGIAVSIAAQAGEPATRSKLDSKLDLRAPPISRIFTPQQIDLILARTIDPDLESVQVEASRISDLPLTDKSASVPEAAFKEVVRWLAPYPTAIAANANATPDATSPSRPVPVSIAWYHAGQTQPYSQR